MSKSMKGIVEMYQEEAIALRKELDSMTAERDALAERVAELEAAAWRGWYEMNAIRARCGVPYDWNGRPFGMGEDDWSKCVEEMRAVLGDLAQPWPPSTSRKEQP